MHTGNKAYEQTPQQPSTEANIVKFSPNNFARRQPRGVWRKFIVPVGLQVYSARGSIVRANKFNRTLNLFAIHNPLLKQSNKSRGSTNNWIKFCPSKCIPKEYFMQATFRINFTFMLSQFQSCGVCKSCEVPTNFSILPIDIIRVGNSSMFISRFNNTYYTLWNSVTALTNSQRILLSFLSILPSLSCK